MMKSVSVLEAKTQLSKLLREVANGEQVVITRHGKPVGRLAEPQASGKILIVDSSISLALLTGGAEATLLQSKLEGWHDIRVPAAWRTEVAMGLLQAIRHGRMEPSDAARALRAMGAPPTAVEPGCGWEGVFQLAHVNQLSIQQAVYLEMALRLGATLATLDAVLRLAAERAGVNLLMR